MLWKIVEVDSGKEKVLGVVIQTKDFEYGNLFVYCSIAISKLTVTDENIEILKRTSLEELLSFDSGSRYGKDLRVVGEHSLRNHFIQETKKYEDRYSWMNCTQLLEEIIKISENIDTLHRHIVLDIANEKGVGFIAHQLLQD